MRGSIPARRAYNSALSDPERQGGGALANVVVGYWLAVGTQLAVFPVFGLVLTLPDNLRLGALFTVLCRARHKTVYAERIVMRSPPGSRVASD